MTDGEHSGWWAADPTRRHELRYWDGTHWTDHVADRGAVSVDPLDAPAVASEPELLTATTPAVPDVVPTPAPSPELVAPPPPPPPVAGTGVDPRADGLGLGRPTWWRSLDGLRTALVVLLGCNAAAAVAAVIALANRMDVIDDVESGRFSFDLVARARDADDAVDLAIGISGALWLATAVVFIIWQWRCAKNAELLGRDHPRFGPGWSIGGWFIPLANFVIPVLIFQDLWRASSPGARPGAWRSERGSALVGLWWAAFLLGGVTVRFFDDDGESLADIRDANERGLAAYGLTIVAAGLAIAVVIQLTKRFNGCRDQR